MLTACQTWPGVYSLVQTVTSYRACHLPDLSALTKQAAMQGQTTGQGPCASLFHNPHKLAWSCLQDDIWADHNGHQVDIVTPRVELEDRLQQAWHFRVMAILEDMRKTMKGATRVDVALTRECYEALPNDHRGLMKCALNGAQFTNDALAHANLTADATCRFCDHRDSPEHRHWFCQFFRDIRSKFPMLDTLEHTEDACLLNHSWLPVSPHWDLHLCNLDNMPNITAEFLLTSEVQPMLFHDLFLDGSCLFPQDKRLRVASWGVVIWTGTQFSTLASGGIPGRRQTSLRGEIMAAISAAQFATCSRRKCRFWIDNQRVVDMLHTLQKEPNHDVSGHKDHDLWVQLQQQLRLVPGTIEVFKVQAHAESHQQDSPLDAWAVQGNTAADRAAAAARDSFPPQFWLTWNHLQRDLTYWRRLGRQLHEMYVEIATKAQKAKAMPDNQTLQPIGIQTQDDAKLDPALVALAALQPEDLPAKYKVSALPHVLAWVKEVCDPRKPVIWVSFHQLMLHFQKMTGHNGPSCDGRRWVDDQPDLYDHRQQVQWFARFLQYACRDASEQLNVRQRRLPSHVLTFWAGHIQVGFTSEELLETDTFLQHHVTRLPARQIRRDMANVPPGWSI